MIESQPDPGKLEVFLRNNAGRIRDGEKRDEMLGLRKKADVVQSISEFPNLATLLPTIILDVKPLNSGSNITVTRTLYTKPVEVVIALERKIDKGNEKSFRIAEPREWIELSKLAHHALRELATGKNGTSSD